MRGEHVVANYSVSRTPTDQSLEKLTIMVSGCWKHTDDVTACSGPQSVSRLGTCCESYLRLAKMGRSSSVAAHSQGSAGRPLELQRTLTSCFSSDVSSSSSLSSSPPTPPVMTAVPPRTSTSPRWDTVNEGFVSPARLQQWKQEHERIHSLGSTLSHTPVTSPPPPDLTATRPTPDRRNTSTESYPNANGSPSKHKSKASFSAFFSRKTSHQDATPPLSSPPLNRRPSTANAALQSQQIPSQLSPPPSQATENQNGPNAPRFLQQQPPPPPQQQQPEQPPGSSASAPPPPQQPPLHPEIRSVVQLTLAHAHKVYFSGPLVRRIERQPDGQKPAKDADWREVWAQLGGTTLSVWNMEEIQEASKQGRQVPPSYINVTDAVSLAVHSHRGHCAM